MSDIPISQSLHEFSQLVLFLFILIHVSLVFCLFVGLVISNSLLVFVLEKNFVGMISGLLHRISAFSSARWPGVPPAQDHHILSSVRLLAFWALGFISIPHTSHQNNSLHEQGYPWGKRNLHIQLLFLDYQYLKFFFMEELV